MAFLNPLGAPVAAQLADVVLAAPDAALTTAFDVCWPDTPHRVLTASATAALTETDDFIGREEADGPPAEIVRELMTPGRG